MRLLRPPHVEEGPWVCRRFLISSLTRQHRQRRCGSCGLPTACCLRASCRACCAPLLSGSRHRLEDIAPGAPATMHQKNKCNCWSQCDVRAAASCPALELRQRPLLLVSPARAVQSSDATTATTCCCTCAGAKNRSTTRPVPHASTPSTVRPAQPALDKYANIEVPFWRQKA